MDVWAVRRARVRIMELNDLRDVMDAIGKALETRIYDPSLTATAGVSDSTGQKGSGVLKPFTKVEDVAPGSPASEAVSYCVHR
jgi:hypothetical protein